MGMRRAMPLFDRASLIHTDLRPSAGPHREEVPIAQAMAFAVVTRTSIRLHLQAIPITRRLLLARLSNRLVPPDCGIPART